MRKCTWPNVRSCENSKVLESSKSFKYLFFITKYNLMFYVKDCKISHKNSLEVSQTSKDLETTFWKVNRKLILNTQYFALIYSLKGV